MHIISVRPFTRRRGVRRSLPALLSSVNVILARGGRSIDRSMDPARSDSPRVRLDRPKSLERETSRRAASFLSLSRYDSMLFLLPPLTKGFSIFTTYHFCSSGGRVLARRPDDDPLKTGWSSWGSAWNPREYAFTEIAVVHPPPVSTSRFGDFPVQSRANNSHEGGREWFFYACTRWTSYSSNFRRNERYEGNPFTLGNQQLTMSDPDFDNYLISRELIYLDFSFSTRSSSVETLFPFHFYYSSDCFIHPVFTPQVYFISSLPLISSKSLGRQLNVECR